MTSGVGAGGLGGGEEAGGEAPQVSDVFFIYSPSFPLRAFPEGIQESESRRYAHIPPAGGSRGRHRPPSLLHCHGINAAASRARLRLKENMGGAEWEGPTHTSKSHQSHLPPLPGSLPSAATRCHPARLREAPLSEQLSRNKRVSLDAPPPPLGGKSHLVLLYIFGEKLDTAFLDRRASPLSSTRRDGWIDGWMNG